MQAVEETYIAESKANAQQQLTGDAALAAQEEATARTPNLQQVRVVRPLPLSFFCAREASHTRCRKPRPPLPKTSM